MPRPSSLPKASSAVEAPAPAPARWRPPAGGAVAATSAEEDEEEEEEEEEEEDEAPVPDRRSRRSDMAPEAGAPPAARLDSFFVEQTRRPLRAHS